MKTKLLTILLLLLAPIMKAQIINTVAGDSLHGYNGDGIAATSAELFSPTGVAVDDMGNLYIADFDNNRVREVDANTGIITTIAGTGAQGFFGDGGLATNAKLQNPSAVAFDDSGNLYISDYNNYRIRKVSKTTGIINTVAGNGNMVYSGDGIPATSSALNDPYNIALDDSGNIYISDYGNLRIRKVTKKTGLISTIAGNGTVGFSGDNGPAVNAELHDPTGVAVDKAGNVYIADRDNNHIRKVTKSTGIITSIAGASLNGGYSGDNGPAISAKLNAPFSLVIDASGNILIADFSNNRIREINIATGIITTIAGDGYAGFKGDGGLADSAQLNLPMGVAVNASGIVYIADMNNNRIRAFSEFPTGINEINISEEVNVYPVPTNGQMTISLKGNGYKSVSIYDITGREIFTQLLNTQLEDINLPVNISNVPSGIYIMQIISNEGIISRKLVKE